jgi:two-component system, NtrC family, nitrogen regulation sensor histidine kinase NtrY
MISRNFRLAIFLRVFFIVALSVTLAFVIVVKPMFFVLAAITLALIALILNLIRYIEKTNKDLTHFLLSIRQGAFTGSYTSGNRGNQHQQLSDALNEIVNEFAKVNEQKELHYQFLQTLNENINVSILSFDEKGDVIMMNQAAKRLFDLPSFSKLEHFKKIDPALHQAVSTLEPEVRTLVKVVLREETFQLSVQLKEIILNGKSVRIVLLQNLNNELESKEIEAWHQLIRVLTHEIMNSVTPIVSLTGAVENILKSNTGDQKDFTKLSSENIDDIYSSLATIQSRSKGLIRFVTSYKEFAKPIDAKFERVDISSLIDRTITLLQAQFNEHKINVKKEIPPGDLTANGDAVLLEQVLINLVKNAIEAVAHDGTGAIRIILRRKNHQTIILVSDNGPGIDAETLPRIFVPFFTTKPKGSGIGLSLSRQIMKIHNGTIKVQSSEKGSVFVMEW